VRKVEGSIGEKVSEEVTNLKDNLKSELSEEIDKKISEKIKEESDRRFREMNLCFFNLPISSDPDAVIRKQHDKDQICQIYRVIVETETDPQIKNVFRLRSANKSASTDTLPVVKVTFVEKHDMRKFLTNAKNIKDNSNLDSNLQKVIVARDLPIKEREENKRLREELKVKNKDGDNYTIRNKRIVPKNVIEGGTSGGAAPSRWKFQCGF